MGSSDYLFLAYRRQDKRACPVSCPRAAPCLVGGRRKSTRPSEYRTLQGGKRVKNSPEPFVSRQGMQQWQVLEALIHSRKHKRHTMCCAVIVKSYLYAGAASQRCTLACICKAQWALRGRTAAVVWPPFQAVVAQRMGSRLLSDRMRVRLLPTAPNDRPACKVPARSAERPAAGLYGTSKTQRERWRWTSERFAR